VRPMIKEAQTFLHEAALYLGLSVPDNVELSIYVYTRRWDLWRHLSKVCPGMRWMRAACCEDATGYVIGVSGDLGDPRVFGYLRHELTHYLLASHFSDFPPWIDEGLAQVMAECPILRGEVECDRREMRRVLNRTSPGELRDMILVPPGERLSSLQYDVARVWTWALLSELPSGKDKIIRYLNETRSGSDQERMFLNIWGESVEEVLISLTRRD
jgi:hypothetical protein